MFLFFTSIYTRPACSRNGRVEHCLHCWMETRIDAYRAPRKPRRCFVSQTPLLDHWTIGHAVSGALWVGWTGAGVARGLTLRRPPPRQHNSFQKALTDRVQFEMAHDSIHDLAGLGESFCGFTQSPVQGSARVRLGSLCRDGSMHTKWYTGREFSYFIVTSWRFAYPILHSN